VTTAPTRRRPLPGGHPGDDPAAAHPRSAWELLPAAVVLALGLAMLLRAQGLWFDELFTAEVARLPLTDIVRAAVEGRGTTSYLQDVPPSYNAPYYLVAHAWLALPVPGAGTSLRLLSLLATAGGVTLLTRAVVRLAGPASGVAAGAAVAFNPLLVQQAVEARSYGLAVLATGAAALGLARWVDGVPKSLWLFGLAGAGMGLAHWYAVPVLTGLVVGGVVLRRREWVPLVAVGVAAALPTVALVGMNLANGNGDRNAGHVRDTGGRLPLLAADAWAGGRAPLLALTVVLAALALARVPRLRVVGAAWTGVPLTLFTAAELVRPVYFPRYLLPALLGLGVLAGAGAVAWRRRVAVPLVALLVGCSLLATLPVMNRPPRERADEVVALLAERQRPGEPVVAADRRAALGLDHYVRERADRLRADLVLPPLDPPPGAGTVWLVRTLHRGALVRTDDDALLERDGLRMSEEVRLPGSITTLVVQRWQRR
jgi:mannosyltransferase